MKVSLSLYESKINKTRSMGHLKRVLRAAREAARVGVAIHCFKFRPKGISKGRNDHEPGQNRALSVFSGNWSCPLFIPGEDSELTFILRFLKRIYRFLPDSFLSQTLIPIQPSRPLPGQRELANLL